MELLIVVLLILIVVGLFRAGGPGKAMTADARGIFSRKCPNCRLRIHDRAQVCRHCLQPTGFPMTAAQLKAKFEAEQVLDRPPPMRDVTPKTIEGKTRHVH